MSTYEKEIHKKIDDDENLPEKINLSMIKYFWQSNPITGKKVDTIPKFLRNIDALKNFTDNELRILSHSMHMRSFCNGERIFNQNDLGVGFYLIYSGYVDVIIESNHNSDNPAQGGRESNYLLTLEKQDYFGEMALLQEKSVRNASAISRDGCELLGIFKPDLEHLINSNPAIATKLLQSVGLIIANRLFSLTREVKELKYKLSQIERDSDV